MPHRIQRERASELLARRGLSGALFAAPASVTWLTGFAPPVQVGPSPFRGQPAYVWLRGGRATCIVQDAHADDLGSMDGDGDVAVVPYASYTVEGPLTIAANAARVLADVLSAAAPDGLVGVELDHTAGRMVDVVQRTGKTTAVDGWLDPLRMLKTDEELAKLRMAFSLADVGHRAAREAVRAGAREIDAWTEIHAAMERAAGRRVPIGNDCVSGRREGNAGGWPGTLELRDGDTAIVDLGAAPDGYWSDSCATYAVGAPRARAREIHGVVHRALERAIGMVRPGVRADEIDRAMRALIEDAGFPVFPHHGGHGVGTTAHEAPRIAPYDDTPLQPGMVIMLEPGIYLPGEVGVRLEHGVLVTEGGAERLTSHDLALN